MNLVGKIITVMLFLMSLMFMGLAVMSYATDQNYKELVSGGEDGTSLSVTLNESRQKLTALEDELERLKRQLAHEQGTRRAALLALEAKSREQSASLVMQQQAFDKLLADHKTNIDLIASSQDKIGGLSDEVILARDKLVADFAARDALLQKIVELTDKLNQGEGQLRRLQQRNKQLTSGF